jgi:hypothetical protein
MNEEVLGACFRDPSAFVFRRDGLIHRQLNRSYAPHYDRLMSCGLGLHADARDAAGAVE